MSAPEVGAAAIEHALGAATGASRLALAAFLTAGFPRREAFVGLLRAVAAEAELVEVGVPWSDPMADGVTIRDASRAALADGVTPAWILEEVRRARATSPVVLMSYLNPLLALCGGAPDDRAGGLDRLAGHLREAGVSGLVVPDLPYEESLPLRDALDAEGLALVQLVTPLTPPDRLARLCAASRGFVYAVTRTGTTGGTEPEIGAMMGYLERVRARATLPVLAGFGIRSADQLAALAGRVAGVIVGSALVEALGRGDDPVRFLRTLRGGERTRSEGGR